MSKPNALLIAAMLVGISLAYTLVTELFFAFTVTLPARGAGFVAGQLVVIALWLGFQAWVLVRLVAGAGWARIVLVILIALGITSRIIALRQPLIDTNTWLAWPVVQSGIEVIAIVILLLWQITSSGHPTQRNRSR